jgi:hypothetical protein
MAYLRLVGPLTVLLVAVGLGRLVMMLLEAAAMPGAIGIDYAAVTDAARRWLDTGQPFPDRQLHGPYAHIGWNPSDTGEFFYPPVTLPFFALFAFLPALAWWLAIALLFALGLRRVRPARWSWPLLAGLAAFTNLVPVLIAGNPALWIAVCALWAPVTGWSGALVLLKPTLAPWAVLGIWRRSWWVAIAVLALASIPFASLWVDWVHAVLDLQESGLHFLLVQAPFMLIPTAALAAGTGPDLWQGTSRLAALRARIPLRA